MLLDSLYHPPHLEMDATRTREDCLYLNHHFEGKPLVKEFISNTMLGIAYLWGGTVKLETSERAEAPREAALATFYGPVTEAAVETEPHYRRVLYTMEQRKLTKTVL